MLKIIFIGSGHGVKLKLPHNETEDPWSRGNGKMAWVQFQLSQKGFFLSLGMRWLEFNWILTC